MHIVYKNNRATISVLLVLSLFIASVYGIVKTQDSNAMPVTGFNPGLIIDDSVFTNRNSMNTAQIQVFLNSKVPICDTWGTQTSEFGGGTRAQWAATRGYSPPFTCLKDFSEGGKTASQIIYDLAQEFAVNPQVLIVLLQKEQALVTDTWPIPASSQYRTATGYGCPDAAPCDAQYYGLTNQLRWSATMFRAIMNDSPTWYTPYILGNNYVQWSANSACGGTTINIQNRATKALYNYTPYQPNQAALNSWPGLGDSCSAYGNRNFYQYFKEWFGNTTGPDYAATFKTPVLYADEALTQVVPKAGSKYIVAPNQLLYTQLEATNTGRGIWNNMTNIGTSNIRDRLSPFQSSAWPGPKRPAGLVAQPVAPNEVGKFNIKLTAPNETGVYNESFGIVQDGVAWMDDTVSFTIQIATPAQSPTSYTLHQMTPGQELQSGQSIISKDTYSLLNLREDGVISLQTDSQIKWTSPSAGAGAKLVMQMDGNLVLYGKSGNAVWDSGTAGNNTSSVFVQEDGNLVVYSSSGSALWSTSTSLGISHFQFPHDAIYKSEVIYSGQVLQSLNRSYTLALQTDGNLVLYNSTRAIWASNTVGSNAQKLVMQPDGNLVLYSKNGTALWSSNTAGKSTSAFYVQKDGNLVIYNTVGPTWASRTSGL